MRLSHWDVLWDLGNKSAPVARGSTDIALSHSLHARTHYQPTGSPLKTINPGSLIIMCSKASVKSNLNEKETF
jgi:hypothetical protein